MQVERGCVHCYVFPHPAGFSDMVWMRCRHVNNVFCMRPPTLVTEPINKNVRAPSITDVALGSVRGRHSEDCAESQLSHSTLGGMRMARPWGGWNGAIAMPCSTIQWPRPSVLASKAAERCRALPGQRAASRLAPTAAWGCIHLRHRSSQTQPLASAAACAQCTLGWYARVVRAGGTRGQHLARG